ncbi:MAG: PHP domain-containing protein, partial [Clostridia bacterium]|nr:PHP domain-containing protein [Clostridia bacterium]
MEKIIDLHTHTVCSDGSMIPADLVRHAKNSGLAAVAVSDHDTADGVKEAMAVGAEVGIEVIPAIELSAISDTETHILGYFIDPDAPALVQAVDNIRAIRTQRIGETCEMLEKYNIHVTL